MTKFFTKITGGRSDDDQKPLPQVPQDETFFADENIPVAQSQEALIPGQNQSANEWLDKEETEGQLSVDVYQTKDNLVIKSTIAGVKPEDIDIAIDSDVVTIIGKRKYEEEVKSEDYFYQECYWGSFSRSIVLPLEVKADEAEASLKNGVLTIALPKVKKNKSVAIKVKGE